VIVLDPADGPPPSPIREAVEELPVWHGMERTLAVAHLADMLRFLEGLNAPLAERHRIKVLLAALVGDVADAAHATATSAGSMHSTASPSRSALAADASEYPLSQLPQRSPGDRARGVDMSMNVYADSTQGRREEM
jgi:hypothetical protein